MSEEPRPPRWEILARGARLALLAEGDAATFQHEIDAAPYQASGALASFAWLMANQVAHTAVDQGAQPWPTRQVIEHFATLAEAEAGHVASVTQPVPIVERDVDMTTAVALLAGCLDDDTATIGAILDRTRPAQLVQELLYLALQLGRMAKDNDDDALRVALNDALTRDIA